MKRIWGYVSFAVLFFTATLVYAGPLGNITGSKGEAIGQKIGKKGLEKAINDKIKKENCAFADSKTDRNTTCDLNKIMKYLSDWRAGLESTVADDVDIHVRAGANNQTLANKRAVYVESLLKKKFNYWDWYTETSTAGDELAISVKVN